MLVLARRTREVVEFPDLGISIEVLKIKGSTVRIGITAPPDIRVTRGELTDQNRDKVDVPGTTHSVVRSTPALYLAG